MKNDILLTFDIDWAPDSAIERVVGRLAEAKIKATFFVTHNSPVIDRLKESATQFELGIHPNFYEGSSHGSTEDDVMGAVKKIVPDAVSMRTHGLYQNTNLLLRASRIFGVKIDASLFLPNTDNIEPHNLNWGDSAEDRLLRVPYFWEDDHNMREGSPTWRLDRAAIKSPGLKIFNFHPIHIVLNTPTYKYYEDIKRRYRIPNMEAADIENETFRGQGTATLFDDLVELVSDGGGGKRLVDIYESIGGRI